MFNLLKSGVNVLAQAAQDVAEELNKVQAGPAAGKSTLGNAVDDGQALFLGPEGRLVLCGFPQKALATEVFREDRSLRPFASPASIKQALQARFPQSSILVWNLAGIKYEYEHFDGNIIEYDFPARPILPFSALVEVANAIQSWLATSPNNVAVVHDISGRRAAVVVACALEVTDYYIKEGALRSIANSMGHAGDALVASQIRYYEYFCISRRPNTYFDPNKQLRLDRVIINGVPDYSSDTKLASSPDLGYCYPYLKVIDSKGVVIYCSNAPDKPVFGKDVSFSAVPDAPVILSSDIMLRFFHSKRGEAASDVPMFAVSFHIGFVTDVVLRFTFHEIDGTAKSPRFPKDMFIDVIFSEELEMPMKTFEPSKHRNQSPVPSGTEMGAIPATPDMTEASLHGIDNLERELNELDLGDVDISNSEETFDMLSSPSSSRAASITPTTLGKPNTVANVQEVEVAKAAAASPKKLIKGGLSKVKSPKSNDAQLKGKSGKPISQTAVNVASSPLAQSSTVEAPKSPPPNKPPRTEIQALPSAIKKVDDSLLLDTTPAAPSPIDLNRGDSVLREIEAALNEDDFAVDDFDLSELDENE